VPQKSTNDESAQTHCISFWEGMEADIDLSSVLRRAVPVKGVLAPAPLRFLEIYCGVVGSARARSADRQRLSWPEIRAKFLPNIPGVRTHIGERHDQPPFTWRECDPVHLCVSFTYNSSAFFRILSMLYDRRVIQYADISSLLDKACLTLSQLYAAKEHFLLRNINNNFNMFLISKVIESLVSKQLYDSDIQELETTRASLAVAIEDVPEHDRLPMLEKMALSLGRGVSFLEGRIRDGRLSKADAQKIAEATYSYFGDGLKIDHRKKLLDMIADAGLHRGAFMLTAILDDAAESILDFLWLRDALEEFPFLTVHLLVNSAQISINFSIQMLADILEHAAFRGLTERLNKSFFVTDMYCPLISFQEGYFPTRAQAVIDRSDTVYVKGANFFETCQIAHKHTFHAFVVYGPVSRTYTGLKDFDAVFVHLPPGEVGFVHRKPPSTITTLVDIVTGVTKRNKDSSRFSVNRQ
jgi:hypothetical protein